MERGSREHFAAMEAEMKQRQEEDKKIDRVSEFGENGSQTSQMLASLHQTVRELLGRDAGGMKKKMQGDIDSHHDVADTINATYDRLKQELEDADTKMWEARLDPIKYRDLKVEVERAKTAFEEFRREEGLDESENSRMVA